MWIEIEGVDGSGKGTQAELLAAALQEVGRTVVLTHEPWEDGERGALIRDVLRHRITELPNGSGGISPVVFQWQYLVNRVTEHFPAVIGPALAHGDDVVSDRGRLSTYSYGSAFGVYDEMIHEWHELAIPQRADILVFLRTLPETCVARLGAAKRGEPEYFERADKISRIAAHYEAQLLKYFSDIAVIVDNERSIEEVHQEILEIVLNRLEGRRS